MENNFITEYFQGLIPAEKELNDFGLWAFGEDYTQIENIFQLIQCWNYHHGKELHLSPNGELESDLVKMVELCRENN